MNLSVLRSDDPVQRIYDHVAHLDGGEGFLHPRLVLLSNEVLEALRQGVFHFDGLPFLILGGKDGRDVLRALGRVFQRWDTQGQPPSLSLIDQTLEQLGVSNHHPYRQAAGELSKIVHGKPHAVRRGIFTVIMAKMLTEHGEYELSGEGHARLFLTALLNEEPCEALGNLMQSTEFTNMPVGDRKLETGSVGRLCREIEDGTFNIQQLAVTGESSDLQEIIMLSALAEDARALYKLFTSPYVSNPKLLTMAASLFAPACLWSDNDNDIEEGRKSA